MKLLQISIDSFWCHISLNEKLCNFYIFCSIAKTFSVQKIPFFRVNIIKHFIESKLPEKLNVENLCFVNLLAAFHLIFSMHFSMQPTVATTQHHSISIGSYVLIFLYKPTVCLRKKNPCSFYLSTKLKVKLWGNFSIICVNAIAWNHNANRR